MNLLHPHRIPFDDPPDPGAIETELRGQIARLHDEKHAHLSLIEDQRVELAKVERERDSLARHVHHLDRQLAKQRRWWWPR